MIDLNFEHEKKLSTQDMYNIISIAIDTADDDGMLNSFTFQRALYAVAAAVVYDDQTDRIMMGLPNFPMLWDELIADNIIDNLCKDYPTELTELCKMGETWFNEYDEHIHSSYAVVTAISDIVENFTNNFKKRVEEFQNNEDINKIMQTASTWGMDNNDPGNAVKDENMFKIVK